MPPRDAYPIMFSVGSRIPQKYKIVLGEIDLQGIKIQQFFFRRRRDFFFGHFISRRRREFFWYFLGSKNKDMGGVPPGRPKIGRPVLTYVLILGYPPPPHPPNFRVWREKK